MEKILSPVIGFYGENDVRVTAAVEPTAAKMRTMGKMYEPTSIRRRRIPLGFFRRSAEIRRR